ncbi:hypothetical protein [Sinomicrobium oceani]|uniref:hypothetical protein n=1 Tax=Sinomicrobium oceani TaxID=1150368 RepID=UPI00227CADB0|nr:hypothetical protein [Sinomicrobium oceani]
MYITDSNGKQITITDLKAAIERAKAFKTYRHENPGFAELDDMLQHYWTDVYEKLLQLQQAQEDARRLESGDITGEQLQTYTLKGNMKNPDYQVTIKDLIPVPHKRKYHYRELLNLINYSRYELDWNTPMGKEYDMLYALYHGYTGNFFKVKDTGLIVIPGTYPYPTLLTEEDIKRMG